MVLTMPSGVKNVQWDQTASSLEVHLCMKLAALRREIHREKIPGRGHTAPTGSAQSTGLPTANFLLVFLNFRVGEFLKGRPEWQETETQDRLEEKTNKQNRNRKRKVV